MSTSVFTFNDIKDALKENKWSSGVAWDLNETTTYEVFDYSTIASNHINALQSASKVIDSKVLDANDTVLMNWNTALFTNSGNSDMKSIFDSSWNLTEWKSDLSSLTDGSRMFYNCFKLTSFDSDLSNLTNGYDMFYSAALASFDSNLSSLTDGSYMFRYCSELTTFNSDLSSLTNGNRMFYNSALTTFNSNLSNLTNGSYMFQYCSALESFDSNLSSLTDGEYMFKYCTSLTSFNSDLSSLTNGSSMFNGCKALTTFNSDLSSLISGDYMFHYCSALASFDSDLSNLTNGHGMFRGCPLTTFNADLSNLTNGYAMFDSCDFLTTFNSDLSSLTDGLWMFQFCKLDTASVQNIADTINDLSDDTDDGNYGWGEIHIDIANATPNSAEYSAFNTIKNKGWDVYVNGSTWRFSDGGTGVSTGSLADGEENTTPIPYWAKPVEVDEEHAKFVSSDGKYYIIQGAQFLYVSDPETYGQFTSYEHAESEIVLALGLTKYTKPTEEKVQ